MSNEIFICYETTTGLVYATHLKEALRKMRDFKLLVRGLYVGNYKRMQSFHKCKFR